MKQKIIFTTIFALICLILLIISPENIFGIITCGDCTLYGPPICEVINGKQQCWKDCIEEAACDDSGSGPGTSPGSGPGSGFSDDTEDGWNCLDNGSCVFVRNQKRVDYSTEAQCLAKCQPRGTYNECRTALPGSWAWLTGNRDTLYCKPASWTGTKPTDQCQKDSDCGKGTPTPELPPPVIRYACNTSTWQCTESSSGSYSTLSSCQTNCKKSTSSTRHSCNTTTWQCYPDSSGKYTSLSSCQTNCKESTPITATPTCSINKFELPNHVWTGVDYEARWSTNSDCKWGEITCKLGDEDCGENETLSGNVTVGSVNHEKSFHIKTPGVYTYQLKACYDKNNENTCVTWEDTLGTELDFIEVQAINLPWWQEIIPVLPDKLQGFLRGLIS